MPEPSDDRREPAIPLWYRTTAAISWRFLVIIGAAAAVIYALHYLRVVVLPIIIALLASTLLLPVVRWLKTKNVPDALAAAGSMLAAFLLLVAIGTAVAPSIGDQFGELRPRAEDGLREATDVLADPPFNLSEQEIRDNVDKGLDRLRENGGPLVHGVQSGAVILGEAVTGLLIAILLTFFLLKDGERMWGYVLGSSPAVRPASTPTRSAPASTRPWPATCAGSPWSAWSTRS